MHATQRGTFCAVWPWSLVRRGAPWPGWELGCQRPEQPERPAGWAPPSSVSRRPVHRLRRGRCHRLGGAACRGWSAGERGRTQGLDAKSRASSRMCRRSRASGGMPACSWPSTAIVRCRAAGRSASLTASPASPTPTMCRMPNERPGADQEHLVIAADRVRAHADRCVWEGGVMYQTGPGPPLFH